MTDSVSEEEDVAEGLSDNTRIVMATLVFGILMWLIIKYQDPPALWAVIGTVIISAVLLPWHFASHLSSIIPDDESSVDDAEEEEAPEVTVPDDLSTLGKTKARKVEVGMDDLEGEFDVSSDGSDGDDD